LIAVVNVDDDDGEEMYELITTWLEEDGGLMGTLNESDLSLSSI